MESQCGVAYSLLKTYVFSQATSMPTHIMEVIQKVDNLRDELGIMETNHDEFEEKHNQQYLTYTQLGETLMESLPDQATGIHTSQKTDSKAMEIHSLT